MNDIKCISLENSIYVDYLNQCNIEQTKLDNFINEALIRVNSKDIVTEMTGLNESNSNKIKQGINNIMEFFKKVWNKFIENMMSLFKRDKKYLEDYRDIIIGKKAEEYEINMYNYTNGLKRISNTPIPAFNYESLKNVLSGEDAKSKFEKHIYKIYNIPNSEINEDDFTSTLKMFFRGSSEPNWVKSSSLNMTDLFNFCYNFDSLKNKIDKDKNAIIKSANDAEKELKKLENKIQSSNESYMFDYFNDNNTFYSYIYEESESPKTEEKNKSGKIQIKKTADSAYKSKEKEDETSKVNSNSDTQAKNNKDIENINNAINIYLNTCKRIVEVKMTIIEEIYKNYIQIIKSHVKYNLGKKDKGENKVSTNPSNFADGFK